MYNPYDTDHFRRMNTTNRQINARIWFEDVNEPETISIKDDCINSITLESGCVTGGYFTTGSIVTQSADVSIDLGADEDFGSHAKYLKPGKVMHISTGEIYNDVRQTDIAGFNTGRRVVATAVSGGYSITIANQTTNPTKYAVASAKLPEMVSTGYDRELVLTFPYNLSYQVNYTVTVYGKASGESAYRIVSRKTVSVPKMIETYTSSVSINADYTDLVIAVQVTSTNGFCSGMKGRTEYILPSFQETPMGVYIIDEVNTNISTHEVTVKAYDLLYYLVNYDIAHFDPMPYEAVGSIRSIVNSCVVLHSDLQQYGLDLMSDWQYRDAFTSIGGGEFKLRYYNDYGQDDIMDYTDFRKEAYVGLSYKTMNPTSLEAGEAQRSDVSEMYHLSFLAQVLGGFVVCDRFGFVTIKKIAEEEYPWTIRPDLTLIDCSYKNDVSNIYTSVAYQKKDGDASSDYDYFTPTGQTPAGHPNTLTLINPYFTQSALDRVSSVNGLNYSVGSISFLGDNYIDPWDVVNVRMYDDVVRRMPCMRLVQSYDGGLTTTIETFNCESYNSRPGINSTEAKLSAIATTAGTLKARMDNLFWCEAVIAYIPPNGSVWITAPDKPGYVFVCWLQMATSGWLGSVYTVNPSQKTTAAFNATKNGEAGDIFAVALYAKT